MEDVRELWARALHAVRQGDPAYLAILAATSGTSPRPAGAKLLVGRGGLRLGTIGGGASEHMLQRELEGDLARNRLETRLHRMTHAPQKEGGPPGPCCPGTRTLAIIALTAREESVLAEIAAVYAEGRQATLEVSPGGLACVPFRSPRLELSIRSDASWCYAEPLGVIDVITMVGGGHVSLALSRVMATLPFRIVVIDDRAELPTMADNVFAHERLVMPLEEVAEHVPEGEHSFVAIMTSSHETDEQVLLRLIEKRLRYLGVLASRSKASQFAASLEQRGLPRAAIEKVRAPIGLRISSHTPEEIAISIAAEIIQEKNWAR
ncbi:MAG: XdhC family protein [Planctomycetota bacterium]